MANESVTKKEAAAEAVDTEKLSRDLAALKEDFAHIASTLRELGLQSRDAALYEGQRRIAAVRSEAHGQIQNLGQSADDLGHQALDTVREKPGVALLAAAAVGMIFGFLTARK